MTETIQAVRSANASVVIQVAYENICRAAQSALWRYLSAILDDSTTPTNARTKNILMKLPKDFWKTAAYPYVIVNFPATGEEHITLKNKGIDVVFDIETYFNKSEQIECVDYIRKILKDRTSDFDGLALNDFLADGRPEVVVLDDGSSIYKYTLVVSFKWFGN